MIRTTITLSYVGSPTATKRAMGAAVRDGLRDVGEYWHDKDLPRHFEESAHGRYGLRRRSYGYRKRKLRVKSHNRPMVWTGRLMRDVTGRAVIRSSTKQGRVKMSSRALNLQPDFKQEITATNDREANVLARRLDRRVGCRLNAVRTRETKTFS